MASQSLLKLSTEEFINYLKVNGIKRFYFVYDETERKVKSSHTKLAEIAEFLSGDKRDFIKHEGLFFQLTDKYDCLLSAFVHKTNRGQAAGGVRFWHYNSVEEFIRDGLRLSVGMTRKNALAGVWWGGGKGVVIHNQKLNKKDAEYRKYIYTEYGKFITSLNGCYITAEDVGTNVEDMRNVFSQTRFTTCIPHDFGGSGNPSVPTARGVVAGIKAALDFRNEPIGNKIVAVQGLGNVGRPLIKYLFDEGVKKIIGFDVNPDNVQLAESEFENYDFTASLVKPDDLSIYETECDIFSPCATGATINKVTIPKLKCKIICGAANNQLEDADSDGRLLLDKGITYIPDFLTNRMGIVNCANEQYGFVDNDPAIEKHLSKDWEYSVYQMTLNVLKQSEKENIHTAAIANKVADELSEVDHPIFGHRGLKIIKSLVENNWEKN